VKEWTAQLPAGYWMFQLYSDGKLRIYRQPGMEGYDVNESWNSMIEATPADTGEKP
jgi:hypothetical protein